MHNRGGRPARGFGGGLAILCVVAGGAVLQAHPAPAAQAAPLKIFLDCEDCFPDFLREEVAFVAYVRDRTEAHVHVLITSSGTGGGGREHTFAFMGAPGGPFDGVNHTLRTTTTQSDPEDVVRRQLATALRIGLLHYVVRDGVPPPLDVSVRVAAGAPLAAARDRWDRWVFTVRGSAAFDGEETSRETQLSGSASADRITPAWKVTLGAEFERESEAFDLDEAEPVEVERREAEFEWLAVKALGDHWSVGGRGELESSTFENTRLELAVAPAIEYNLFPYSMYARRQLRTLYAVGIRAVRYHEPTLFGRTQEARPAHEVSLTFEQREPWGSVEARTEWSQYLHALDRTRLEVEGDLSVRIARGLSVGAEASASRIRDQLSLPARGATPEEVLLRLRRLESGYEYRLGMSLTYTFGSIFSSIVNPRFGQ